MARVLLVRHCQSTGQSFDSPLSETGRRQALALATWLHGRGVDRIVSSPFKRAVDTIAPFASRAGLEVELNPRLGERVLGAWFETPESHWAGVRTVMEDREKRYGDGESGVEVTARGWPALREALDGRNALTVLVSHGQMSSHLLREIDGTSGYDVWMSMTTPDVFEIRDTADSLKYERIWQPPAV